MVRAWIGRAAAAALQQPAAVDEGRDETPPTRIPDEALRAVADGGSLASVARWFDLTESELEEWITDNGDPVPADPEPESFAEEGDAAPPAPVLEVKALSVIRTHAPEPAEETAPVPPVTPSPVTPSPVTASPVTAPSAPAGEPRRPPRTRSIATAPSNRNIGPRRQPSAPSATTVRDSVQVLRRRLLVVIVGLLVGAAAGWVTAPGETRRSATFQATHTLIYEAHGGQSYNIEQVALLATSGDVPSRVAAKLGLDRSRVRSAVSAAAKAEVSTISITARSSTADGAVALADTTAGELVAELAGRDQGAYDSELDRLTGRVRAAQSRLNALPARDTTGQAAARAELQAAERDLQQYQSAKPAKSELQTLEEAAASAVRPPGMRAPDSKPVRAGLLGGVGLLVGLLGAFGLDRLDRRIRSKASAEEAFGVPVIAEVPRISKAVQGELLARTQPSSPFVEAYRGLRTYVALWAPEIDQEDGHRVLVVTSPLPGEGKTTTVAHVAAMLAEIGRSVVVVSADLRRPRLHEYFDLPAGPGLVEALAAKQTPPVFVGLDRPTSVRGVRLVPSGPPLENPAPLFEHAGELVHAVRGLADFVLIDAPPLLVANDAVEMARHADGVVLVARSGQTTVDASERSAEILERLEIPIVGAVLVGSEAASSASRYYAARYYAEPDRAGWLRRRPAPVAHEAPPAANGR